MGEDLASKSWDALTPIEKAQVWATPQMATELRQGAADEYAAHLAEKVIGNETLTPKEQSIWDKIVSAIKKLFGQMDDTAIADALVQARDNLRQGEQAQAQLLGEGQRFSVDENGENIRRNEESSVPLQEENHPLYKGWEKRNVEINTSDYEATDDFRRLQEESRRRSQESIVHYWGLRIPDVNVGQRLASIFRHQLDTTGNAAGVEDGSLGVEGKPDTNYTIRKNVSGKLFHDIFEIARGYLPNGELVDLHDNYDGYVCYLSEDGTSGFAINQETGYIASAFNLGVRKSFLRSISDYIRKEGATYGDCYNSNRQPLREIYERAWGAKIAATMDFNEAYDTQYDIGKNHGNPLVAFVVIPEKGEGADIKEEHFGKDEYDEALMHTLQYVTERGNETNEENPQFSAEERILSDVQGQKQVGVEHDLTPAQMQEMDNLNEDTRFSSKEDRLNRLGGMIRNMRPDMSDEQRNTLLDYVEGLRKEENGPTMEIATLKWYLMGNIRIPEDMQEVRRVVAIGKKAGVDVTDIKRFPNPESVVDEFPQVEMKDPPMNPDEVETLTNKKTYPNGITVYDVENSEEGRMDMRYIIDTHLGKDHNPWCLLGGNGDGTLNRKSYDYWYDDYPRFGKKVAFDQNGKLVAFFAAGSREKGPTWWDVQDHPTTGIPVKGKIPNDPLGRSGIYEYNIPIEDINESDDYTQDWSDEAERLDEIDDRCNEIDERLEEIDSLIDKIESHRAMVKAILYTIDRQLERLDDSEGTEQEKEAERARLEEERANLQAETDEYDALVDEKRDLESERYDLDDESYELEQAVNKRASSEGWRSEYDEGINSPTEIHKGNKKNGDYTEWWDEDPNHIKEQAHYKDGELVGEYRSYHKNGTPNVTCTYNEKGRLDGKYTKCASDGRIIHYASYENGDRIGPEISYWDNGDLRSFTQFGKEKEHGYEVQDGIHAVFTYDGKLISFSRCSDGVSVGERGTWYSDGGAETYTNYEGGAEDSFKKAEWTNGGDHLISYTKYDGSNDSSQNIKFSKDGQLELIHNYKNHEQNGPQLEVWYDGTHRFTLYDNGELVGQAVIWNPQEAGARYGDTTPAPLSARETAEAIIKDADIDGVKREGEEMLAAANQLRHDAADEVHEAAKKVFQDEGDARFSVNEEGAAGIVAQMEEKAEKAPVLELTKENWEKEFGKDNTVSTPLGIVKMGENQYAKLVERRRESELGMVKPTLENPDIIIEAYDPEEGAERDTKYLFIKTFIKANGDRIVHYESVTVRQDGMEVSISSHEMRANGVKKEIQNGVILHLNDKISLSSEWPLTEAPNRERPDLLPTSDISESKGSENSGNARENAENLQGEGEFNTPQGEAERFSISDKGPKTMLGAHSITEEKLRKGIKLGVAINPSFAFYDRSIPETSLPFGFGGITFLASRDMLDNMMDNNELVTQTGDTWSSQVPHKVMKRVFYGWRNSRQDAYDALPSNFQMNIRLAFWRYNDFQQEAIYRGWKPEQINTDGLRSALAPLYASEKGVKFTGDPMADLQTAYDYLNEGDHLKKFDEWFDKFLKEEAPLKAYISNTETEYTPENLSEYMRDEDDTRQSIEQRLYKRLYNTDDIRDNRHRLEERKGGGVSSDWAYSAIDKMAGKESFDKSLNAAIDTFNYYYWDDESELDSPHNYDMFKETLQTDYPALTDNDVKDIFDYFRYMRFERQAPFYFEGKSRRNVPWSDFSAMIAPENLSQDIRDYFEDIGMPIYYYKQDGTGREEALTEATEADDGIMFSVEENPQEQNENARFSTDEEVAQANERWNKELERFENGKQRGNLHLGVPSWALRASGLNGSEMYIKPKVLKAHLKKHNLTINDIKDLPRALQNPLLVYEWGKNYPSILAITEIEHGNDRITIAVKLERDGKRLEINELASIHPMEVNHFLSDMAKTKDEEELREKIHWVGDKEKTLDWLGLVPTTGTASLTNQEQSVAKIIQDFENPKFGEANLQGEGEFNTPQGEARFSAQEQERQDIIEQARQDGTLGKAPNGAESNLMRQGGEQLWATVRTPAFKNWFGDWESAAKVQAIEAIRPTAVESKPMTRQEAWNNYKQIGIVANKADNREVNFTNASFKKRYRKDGLFVKAIPALKEAFENSILAYTTTDTLKGTKRKDGTIHKEHPNIKWYHNYIGKVRIDGNDYYARFTIKEERGNAKDKLHSTFVTNVELYKKGTTPLALTYPSIELRGKHQNEVVDVKLQQFFDNARKNAENSSKVVDENGEPKVVYHGSRTGGEFSTFEGTTFFTDNRDVADMFRQEGAYLVRVNGHEPMMMDGRDVEELAEYLTQGDYDAKELADWGKLSKELLQESMEELLKYEQQNIKDILRLDEDEELTGLSIKETAPVFEVFLNIRNPEVMDFNNTVWTVDNAPERGEREAKDTGHDGMVINNIVEGGYAAELLNGDEVPPATDYVVFNPNQVKSIDNNGNFSSVDNDIRFSTEEAQQRQEAPQHEDLFARAERIANDYQQQREQQREEATLKWYLTGNIRIPEDMPNVRQAVKESFKIV